MNKVSVYGGLGNQMFQYAFYKALNVKGHKARLSFSGYLYYKHHNGFDLARAFKLPEGQGVLKKVLLHGDALYGNKIVAGILRRAISWYDSKKNIYKEKREFEFDEKVFEQQNKFFVGTWQSELYFKDLAAEIKKDFEFKIPVGEKNKIIAAQINNCNAVSIHVRRGDYLNAHWQKSLGVINGTAYYEGAIKLIETKITAPHYFVFSDDIVWVKENLHLANCTYVDHNKGKLSYADMYLMSLCRHNIIANSTFSWWAAWLNKNADKTVVMPERWLNDNDCKGIFPDDWIRMKV
jgi:hypothetical protein